MKPVSLLLTLAALWSWSWSASVSAEEQQLKEIPVAPTVVQPPFNANEGQSNERKGFAAAQASQPSVVIPRQPDTVPAGAQTVLKDSPMLKHVPLNTTELRLQDNPDSILNSKTLPDNPPLILKDILFTPPDLKHDQYFLDGKPIIANPILNDNPSLVYPELKDKPALVDKPVLLSPHSPSARAVVLPPADDSPAPPAALPPTEELKQNLEDSLIQIKQAINEASPKLIAAASGGTSKIKLDTADETELKPEKPEVPTRKKTYAEIVGQFVTQLLEIPIVLLGAFREVLTGLTGTKVSIQVSNSNQHKPLTME